jgi:ribosomal protein L17
MQQLSNQPITQDGIERFRARARELRTQAELTIQPTRRQELSETALAYERMAERGEQFLANGKSP